jgi:hypothetical protein
VGGEQHSGADKNGADATPISGWLLFVEHQLLSVKLIIARAARLCVATDHHIPRERTCSPWVGSSRRSAHGHAAAAFLRSAFMYSGVGG